MTNRQLARIHVRLRVVTRMRQSDVAKAARVARWVVWKLEAGEIDDLRVGNVRSCFEALGGRIDVTANLRGAELDRLLDEVHARLVGQLTTILRGLGWEVRLEVSFSGRGDRGSIDLLAWHAGQQALLVVEVKSELAGLEGLLRPLDIKVRHAAAIAHERFGWSARTVSRIVVLPEDRTARRLVGRHEAVLAEALPARSRRVRKWLRQPVEELAGLWFLTLDRGGNRTRNPSAVRRVQRPKSRSGNVADAPPMPGLELIDPHKVGRART